MTDLNEMLNDPQFADLLAETAEEQEFREKLLDVSRYAGQEKMSLDDSAKLIGVIR